MGTDTGWPWTEKSTNGRIIGLLGLLGILVAPLAVADPSAPQERALEVCAHEAEWAREVVPARGSAAWRLRRLHARLLQTEAPASSDFAFRMVALARETGIPAYFVAVDAPSGRAMRGRHLAVGIGHLGRIVVFDRERKSRPDHGRLRLLDDRTAAAIRLGEAAESRLAAGDIHEALEQLETALALDPEIAWAWSALGRALRHEGRRERAMDAYERALELAAIRAR